MIPSCNWKPKEVSDNMTLIGLRSEKPNAPVETGIAVHLIRWRKATPPEVSKTYFEEYIREAKAEGRLSERTTKWEDTHRSCSLRWQWIRGIIRATAAFRLPDESDVSGGIWVVATYSTSDPHCRSLDPDATVLFQSLIGSLRALRYKGAAF